MAIQPGPRRYDEKNLGACSAIRPLKGVPALAKRKSARVGVHTSLAAKSSLPAAVEQDWLRFAGQLKSNPESTPRNPIPPF